MNQKEHDKKIYMAAFRAGAMFLASITMSMVGRTPRPWDENDEKIAKDHWQIFSAGRYED